jgi:hypothetical protein
MAVRSARVARTACRVLTTLATAKMAMNAVITASGIPSRGS